MGRPRVLAPAWSVLALVFVFVAPTAVAQTNLAGWAEHGQTWLVWSDDLGLRADLTDATTYDVYRSDAPIEDVAAATLVGRLFPSDWTARRLKLSAGPDATFTIPDGRGGSYTLAEDEVAFAYTAHTKTAEWFAVIASAAGAGAPPADARVGPIHPSADPVRPHLQHTGIDGGHPYSVYGIWIDGSHEYASGTAQFPVMGNGSFHGVSQLFCVFEPQTHRPSPPVPATLFLHGSGGSYWRFRPSESAEVLIDLNVEHGLYVTLDDSQYVFSDADGLPEVVQLPNRWFGHVETYDRFSSLSISPPDESIVVDYSLRWIDFVLDWLIETQAVDADRISISGLSNGARGVMNYVRTRPGRISAGVCFVPPFDTEIVMPAQTGSLEQNLATNLPGAVGFVTFMDPRTTVLADDLPFLRMIWGTNDTQVPWGPVPQGIFDIAAQRRGSHLYWDQRGHTAGGGPWAGAYFVGSPRHDPRSLLVHRRDQSFPAFFDVDHSPSPGVQPLPENPPGDPWGTWGGWFEWDPSSVLDTPGSWECDLSLVLTSPFPGDLPPAPSAVASVLVRRPQAFLLVPGQRFRWKLRRTSDGRVIQSGLGVADAAGRASVSDLPFSTETSRLELEALARDLFPATPRPTSPPPGG